MDYEKKYKEALDRARIYRDNAKAVEEYSAVARYENIFPELRESEDESRYGEKSNLVKPLIKQNMESYEKIKKVLALGFMNFLDENRPKDKMCLSNGECADIEKAFNEQDWPKLERYLDKYTESEDERIRKALVAYLKSDFISPFTFCGVTSGMMLDYLEKQKEQKPNYCHHEVDETGWTEEYRKAYYDGWNNCNMQHEQLKADHKPAEWSEEDEKMRTNAVLSLQYLIEEFPNAEFIDSVKKEKAWLKSLRSSWKPSEEQMEALYYASYGGELSPDEYFLLTSLYEQLKKL